VAETKTTLKLLGKNVPVTEVPITSRKELPAEYELEDGSFLRIAAPVTTVYRLDGEFDAEGNPVYFVKNGIAVNVVHAKDEVKKK
jgi:hypothetical protein